MANLVESEATPLLAGLAPKIEMPKLHLELKSLTKRAFDGPLSLRILAMLAGLGMAVNGALGLCHFLSPFYVVSQAYLCAGGMLVMILEASMCVCTRTCKIGLQHWARFLSRLWGRGLLYVALGTIALSQWKLLDMISGGCMLFVGILSVGIGLHTSSKLAELRTALKAQGTDTEKMQAVFHLYDKDGSGSIDAAELGALATALGMLLTRDERDAALSFMDEDSSGAIDYHEFETWWLGENVRSV